MQIVLYREESQDQIGIKLHIIPMRVNLYIVKEQEKGDALEL